MSIRESQVIAPSSPSDGYMEEEMKTLPKMKETGQPPKSDLHTLPRSLRYFFYILMGAQTILLLVGMIENFME